MSDPSFSSLYVIPNFPSMLFSYLFTTCSPLPFLFPCLYSADGGILLIIPVLSGEFSTHNRNSHRVSCLEVTRGLGQNGRNFSCDVGATQPIEIFLPLCLAISRNGVDLIFSDSFLYSPWNGTLPFPHSSPHSSPSIHLSHPCLDEWSASTGCAESK